MKSIACLISVYLLTSLLSGCGPAESQRIPDYPYVEDYGVGVSDSDYFVYQSYDYIYHPRYYAPYRGGNIHYHR